MNKREYLRSLGFTVGERGRFTDAMKSAIAKYDGVFDEESPPTREEKIDPTKKLKGIPVLPPQFKQREARTLIGYTKEGFKVGFVLCAYCNQHMVWCDCDKVTAPSVVVKSDDPYVKVLTR